MIRYRQRSARRGPVGQNPRSEYERHREPREQVADHRLARPYPGPRQQRARRPEHAASAAGSAVSRSRSSVPPRSSAGAADACRLPPHAGHGAAPRSGQSGGRTRSGPRSACQIATRATSIASAARPAIRSSALSQYGSQASSRKSSTRVLPIARPERHLEPGHLDHDRDAGEQHQKRQPHQHQPAHVGEQRRDIGRRGNAHDGTRRVGNDLGSSCWRAPRLPSRGPLPASPAGGAALPTGCSASRPGCRRSRAAR